MVDLVVVLEEFVVVADMVMRAEEVLRKKSCEDIANSARKLGRAENWTMIQRSRDPAGRKHSSTPGSPIAQGTHNEGLDAQGHHAPAGHSRPIAHWARVQ